MQISVDWLGSLLILKVKPLRGFLHLVKNRYVKEICRRYGPYHVSLCHWRYFTDGCVEALAQLQQRLHGWRGRLHVADIRSEGYLLMGDELAADPAVQLLHRSGKYRDWGLHISA